MSNRPTPELLEKHTEMQREIATEAVEHAVTLMEACRTHGASKVKVAGIEIEMGESPSLRFVKDAFAVKTRAQQEVAEANHETAQSAATIAEAPLDPETADLETLYHSAQ